MEQQYPPPLQRNLITLFALSGGFMTQLDATIAVVALPHMQASTSASLEQITWVLTSYIVMGAIFTPLSGWLAARYGSKNVMVVSVIGFTVASILCGLAANFSQLIGFRLLQGMMGAALLPISQAMLLDINPPERHGRAMAAWGMGAVLGPIVGPVLGGFLTDQMNWRWIFYINVPIGIASAVGLLIFMPKVDNPSAGRLDFVGFSILAIAIAAFQLMLDRGQLLDWFDSTEIVIEAVIAAVGLYLFIIHSLTTDRPFVRLELFKDRNFLIGNVLACLIAGVMFGIMALTAPMLAELMHYPVDFIGLVLAPRGVGTMIAMLASGALMGKVDSRLLILTGLFLVAVSLEMMVSFSLQMDSWPMILSGFVQGLGVGIMFVPILTAVFATIAPSIRSEGAAFSSLIRNLAGSIWISVLQFTTIRNAATVQARLTETVRPDNPALQLRLPDFDFGSLSNLALMDQEIVRQALMVAYVDSFWLLLIACLLVAPVSLLIRR